MDQYTEDTRYMEALGNIIENKTLFQRILFSNNEWIDYFVSLINSTTWVRVYAINNTSPLSLTIEVIDAKNATPMHIVKLVCQSIAESLKDPSGSDISYFAKMLINGKQDFNPTLSYIDGYTWISSYIADLSTLTPMFSMLSLLDNMFDIRF